MTASLLEGIVRPLFEGEPGSAPSSASQVQLMSVRAAVEQLIHASFTYRCDACEFEWAIGLTLGVEGPPTMAVLSLTLPCPFTTPCLTWPIEGRGKEHGELLYGRCEGTMSHVDWHRDQKFGIPMVPADDTPRFVLPREVHSMQGAELYVPEPALIRARRFHADRQEPS